MAKISDLPVIAAPDGSETVVVMKDNVAQRTSIQSLVAGATSDAVNAVGEDLLDEDGRIDKVADNLELFAGLADSLPAINGVQGQVVLAQAAVSQALVVGTVPRRAGPASMTGTAFGASAVSALIDNEPFDSAGLLDSIDIWAAAGGPGLVTLKLATRNPDGTFNYKSTLWSGALATDNNTIALGGAAVAKGDYLVIRRASSTSASLAYNAGAGGSMFQATGDLTGNNAAVTNSTFNLLYRLTWRQTRTSTDATARATNALSGVGDMLDLPVSYSYGRQSIAPTTSTNSKNFVFSAQSIGQAMPVRGLKFRNITAAGIMQFGVFSPDDPEGSAYTCRRLFECNIANTGAVSLIAGTDFDSFTVGKGWRVGFRPVSCSYGYLSGGAGYQYTSSPVLDQSGIVLTAVSSGFDLEVVGEGPGTVLSLYAEQAGDRLRGTTLLTRQMFPGTAIPANWTPGTWAVSNGLVSPAAGGWTSYAQYNVLNHIKRRTERAIIRFNTVSAAIKIFIGRIGSQGGALVLNCAYNQLELYTGIPGTLLEPIAIPFTSPPGTIAGRRYMLEWKMIDYRALCRLTDLATQESVVLDVFKVPTSATTAKGNFVVGLLAGSGAAGDVTVEQVGLSADVSSSPYVVFLGDSNLDGTTLTNNAYQTYAMLLNGARNKGDVLVAAKYGETSGGLVSTIAWLSLLTPRYVWVNIGTNDTDQAVWRANVSAIIAAITATGATPVLSTLPPKTGGIYLNANADIRTGYFGPYPYVDICSAVTNSHDLTNWASGMDIGDGIHISAVGHKMAFRQLRSEAPYLLDGSEASTR